MTYGSRWERQYKWLSSICVDNGYPTTKENTHTPFVKENTQPFYVVSAYNKWSMFSPTCDCIWIPAMAAWRSCRKGIGSCLFIKNKHGHPGGQRPFFCIKSGDVTFNRKPDTCYFWCGYMAIIRWAGSCSQQLFGVSWSHCIKSFWYVVLCLHVLISPPPRLCSVFGDMGS